MEDVDYRVIFDAWNAKCGILEKVEFEFLAQETKNLARDRWKERPHLIYWEQVVTKISESDFCTGGGESGWLANVDWLVRPGKHTKVFQGYYTRRPKADQKKISSKFKKKVEPNWDCSWCGQAGYVFAKRDDVRYEFVFRCQCEFGLKHDQTTPMWFSEDLMPVYHPRFYSMSSIIEGPERIFHKEFTEEDVLVNKKRLREIIETISMTPIRGIYNKYDSPQIAIEIENAKTEECSQQNTAEDAAKPTL